MLKRMLLGLWLSSGLALAAPHPSEQLDRPGVLLADAEREQILSRWEGQCRRLHDEAGLLEVECRRLIPLLRSYDLGCPPRVAVLRDRLPALPSGRARAYCLLALSWDAAMRHQRELLNGYLKAFLNEPGLRPRELARELYGLDEHFPDYLVGENSAAMLRKLTELQRQKPDPALLWAILSLQLNSARMKGQRDLVGSLNLARLGLAEKEKWAYEQVAARLSTPESKDWKQLLRLSRGSEALRQWVLPAAPNVAEFDRAASGLKVSPRLAARRMALLPPSERIQPWLALIRRDQLAGDVEDEIRQRSALAYELRTQGQREAALRQLRAALQSRLDHPLADSDWGAHQFHRGGLALELAFVLGLTGRRQQEKLLREQILAEGWCDDALQRFNAHSDLINRAREEGDASAYLSHWQACIEVCSQLEAVYRPYSYLWTARQSPASQSSMRLELLSLARSQAEAELRGQRMGTRDNALVTLAEILQQQGDQSGLLQLWKSEWESARPYGGPTGDHALMKMLRLQLEAGQVEAAKGLARQRLLDSDVPEWVMGAVYELAPLLAEKGDAEALVWADRGVAFAPLHPKAYLTPVRAYLNQARVFQSFQRYPAALKSLEEAEKLKPNWQIRVELGVLRASILARLERRPEAVAVLEELVRGLLASEEPAQAVTVLKALAEYREDWESDYEKALAGYQALGEVGEQPRRQLLSVWLQKLAGQQQWQRGREVLTRHPWGPGLDEATQKLQEHPQWRDLLPESGQVQADPASLNAVVDELRLSRPDLGQLLSLRSTNLKQLQSRLSPQDTLVTYCSTGDELYLLALTAERGFWRKSPLSSAQLRQLQHDYLMELSAEKPGAAESRLQAALLAPVLQEQGNQRIYLVPSGELWQLPFGALRDGNGVSAASRAELVLLSSGDLLRLADRSWQPFRLSQPLAIGAPSPTDLPGAYRELEEVSRVLPGCVLKRGEEATCDTLYAPEQRWGLLHFASHAHYNRKLPLESDIELRDGPLKLKQLSQLSLAEHSLVTLSCCQGGAAAGQKLDEPVTLATGFSAAGAETVVANLWPVEDEVARLFFTDFYRELAAGSTPLKSFRGAQLRTRQAYPDPRDWAGFFLLGNPS